MGRVDLKAIARAGAQLERSQRVLATKLEGKLAVTDLLAPALSIAQDLRKERLPKEQLGARVLEEAAAWLGGDVGGKLGAVAGFLLAPLSLPVIIGGSLLGAYFGKNAARSWGKSLAD
ncbi:MAG: hypothetical protein U1E65_21080 [Myxococcota bacterium]